jgi:hypothetical protein
MPVTTLAVRIWAFCAPAGRAGGDRWLDPGLAAGQVSRGSPGGPWIGTCALGRWTTVLAVVLALEPSALSVLTGM